MAEKTRVLGVCGSLGDNSATRVSVRTALEAARADGATTTLVDLRDYDLPPYRADGTDAGDATEVRRLVDEADAVLLGTPVYHGSYASPLKTAIDYCSRNEFGGLTVGLLAVAGGSFLRSALAHLQEVCLALDAWPVSPRVAVPRSGSTVEADRIADPDLAERVRKLGRNLVAYAGVSSYPVIARPTANHRATSGQ